MAKKTKKAAKKPARTRDGYEQILLRVRPEVREMLDATVEGMNASRRPGDPPYSMTGIILMAIANTFGSSKPEPREQLVLKHVKGAA